MHGRARALRHEARAATLDSQTARGLAGLGAICALGVGLVAGACSTSFSPVGEARLAWKDAVVVDLVDVRRPVVHVAIDGHRELPFLVDTGSSLSLVDPHRADELGLRVGSYAAPFTTKGSDGRELPIDRCAYVRRLEVGSLALEDTFLALLDSDVMRATHVHGILGQDLLARLAIVIDRERRKLHVLPPGSDRAAVQQYLGSAKLGAGQWEIAPMTLRPSPYFPLGVRGLEGAGLEVMIDTGADTTSLPQRAIDALGLAPIGVGHARTIAGVHEVNEYRLENFPVFSFRVSADVRSTPADTGLLGMDILGELVFVIDGPGKALWLHQREPASAEPR